METARIDPDISYDLSVALSEACANAVEHGKGASTENYRVTAFIDGDRCRIEVADHGPGFDGKPGAAVAPPPLCPVPALAEHGRGIRLIEALADHVHFRDRAGRGVVVIFDKVLRRREDPPLTLS
jgi:serine/threonine-protein kinase RsbW